MVLVQHPVVLFLKLLNTFWYFNTLLCYVWTLWCNFGVSYNTPVFAVYILQCLQHHWIFQWNLKTLSIPKNDFKVIHFKKDKSHHCLCLIAYIVARGHPGTFDQRSVDNGLDRWKQRICATLPARYFGTSHWVMCLLEFVFIAPNRC